LLQTGGAATEIDTIQVRSSANLHQVDLGETATGREAFGHAERVLGGPFRGTEAVAAGR